MTAPLDRVNVAAIAHAGAACAAARQDFEPTAVQHHDARHGQAGRDNERFALSDNAAASRRDHDISYRRGRLTAR